jgi:HCOMODA/2-hydroxy-3-carboxy-muconic semialdehyde decarboxylase
VHDSACAFFSNLNPFNVILYLMKSSMTTPDRFAESSARRAFLTAFAALSGAALLAGAPRVWANSKSAGPADAALIADLVAAYRILAAEGVVDGYGHVSARHDKSAERFLISRSLAPELVTETDIVELDMDAIPVDPDAPKLYLERFIHSEIYKVRPDVKAVVHHHSPDVVPFSVSSVPLRPVYHMAAFVSEGVPVFEIREAAGMTDMLVRNPDIGMALAKKLGDKPALLMRGHGAVVVGDSLMQAVGRSIYLQMNARLQAQAMALGGDVTYLDPEEARKIQNAFGYDRAWNLWKRKVLLK